MEIQHPAMQCSREGHTMGDTAFVHPCCVTLHRVSKAVVLPPKPSSGRFPSAPLATRSVSMASTHNQLLHVGLQNFTQKLARPARLPGGFCPVKRFADASLQRDIQRAPQDLCNHASCALQVNPRVTLRALLALATWPFRRHSRDNSATPPATHSCGRKKPCRHVATSTQRLPGA